MKHLWHTALQQLHLSYLAWIIPKQIAIYSFTMKQTNVDSVQLLIFIIIYRLSLFRLLILMQFENRLKLYYLY